MRLIAALLALGMTAVSAHDDGRYADSPNHEWFENQHNYMGQWCCNEADGHRYDGGYAINDDGSVSVGDYRIEPYKVLSTANPTGSAVWWYVDGAHGRTTYCFSPGQMG